MPTGVERRAGCRPGVGDVAAAVGVSETVMPDPVGVETRDPPGIAERPAVDAGDRTCIIGIVAT